MWVGWLVQHGKKSWLAGGSCSIHPPFLIPCPKGRRRKRERKKLAIFRHDYPSRNLERRHGKVDFEEKLHHVSFSVSPFASSIKGILHTLSASQLCVDDVSHGMDLAGLGGF